MDLSNDDVVPHEKSIVANDSLLRNLLTCWKFLSPGIIIFILYPVTKWGFGDVAKKEKRRFRFYAFECLCGFISRKGVQLF